MEVNNVWKKLKYSNIQMGRAWRMWGGYEKYDNPHILCILIFFVISKFFENFIFYDNNIV